MKKFAATTAITLSILSTAQFAEARDRFTNLRPSQPTIEVNYGALRFLEPDGFAKQTKPANAPTIPAATQARPEGKIHAIKRSDKIVAKPKPEAKSEEKTQPISLVSSETKKTIQAPAPETKVISAAAPTVKQNITRPALDVPNFTEIAEIQKPAELAPPANEFPKLSEINFPELKPMDTKPMEVTAVAEVRAPELPSFEPAPEAFVAPELPSLEPAPEAFIAPELPSLPSLSEEIAEPNLPTLPNEVVLPPLFPDESSAVAEFQAPAILPPLDSSFAGNSDDSLVIPELPKNQFDDLPTIPAPEIANLQVNDAMPSLPKPSLSVGDMNISVPFNETETQFPLSEQDNLDKIAESLIADKNMILTINGYASGTVEQSSQAKRTSLSRALSVRKYLLQNEVESEQIIVQPRGNDSGVGVPDRVDLILSKKSGA